MSAVKTAAALALGLLTTLAVTTSAQNGQDRPDPANGIATLVLDELALINWLEISDVAALREGVIDKMELKLGMPVLKAGVIGTLHTESAALTVAKNKVLAEATGAIEKGKAQKKVADSIVARNKRLNVRSPGVVSNEEAAKAQGDLEVAEAVTKEVMELSSAAKAELALAQQSLEEHTIRAPFDGIVVKRMKNPGESVRDNEAVVKVGKLSVVCADAYVPLKFAYRVKEGQKVVIQPKITSNRGEISSDRGELLPVETKKFLGKITFVDPEIQPVAETAVRIRAEFENPDFELRPGLKVQMTIYLASEVAARVPPPGD